MDKKISVAFADESIKEAYIKTKDEDPRLYKFLERATDDIKKDPFCGIQIPKNQIPRTYKQKYGIDNLWKYNLPNAWRLIYSVAGDEIEIIAILLEWFSHKEYEKRFHY
ncbi:type II toxin-antitoxin system YoeB family toxin [Acidiplasma sp.]|uniref:type II toxin-antitoxin system YoeB family toxin n=1 Tax=Acidiplasma sp. TaxID=1872114 RepID=UPI00258DD279|nr:type II toxin-antitoxin system YoeB family toxin [Acidiplasma sp.]